MKHITYSVSRIRMSVPIISTLIVAVFTAGLWAAEGVWKAPPFLARKKNPVPADMRSLATGKTLYIQECLKCHGDAGKGDGPANAYLEKHPADLTGPGLADQSDGEVFWKITVGRSPMPTFETLMTEEQRWDVVNYLRSLATTVPVTSPRYEAPAPYRQAISTVIGPYLALSEYMAGDDPDVPTSLAQVFASAVSDLTTIDLADLPEEASQPWQELTQGLSEDVEKLRQAQDTDAVRLQLKAVSGSLTGLVQAFGHAQDAPLVLLDCDLSFDKAGASWLQGGDSPHNPYIESEKDRDCGQVVARLAPAVGGADKPAS
jgi:mono/diheme cytochrome c family protein